MGYSAADVRPLLLDTWNYLQCRESSDPREPAPGRVDFFALNSYSWCGDSSYTTSGYDVLVSDFAKTSVPVFFSEYGCNVPTPRIFTEVPSLYGPDVTPVLSGGLVYEYSEEDSNYGLVTLNTDGTATVLGDYDSLQKQFNTLNTTLLQGLQAQNTTNDIPVCKPSLIVSPDFLKNFTLPAVPPGAQTLIDNGISNPNQGKLVPVTALDVKQVVKSSNGVVITGLAIKPLADDQSNVPSGQTPPSTTSTAPPAATTSKKSAAPSVQRDWAGLALASLVVVAWVALN